MSRFLRSTHFVGIVCMVFWFEASSFERQAERIPLLSSESKECIEENTVFLKTITSPEQNRNKVPKGHNAYDIDELKYTNLTDHITSTRDTIQHQKIGKKDLKKIIKQLLLMRNLSDRYKTEKFVNPRGNVPITIAVNPKEY